MLTRVTDISLVDIMKKYLNRPSSEFEQIKKQDRYKTLCPFHNDTNPSLILYDKTKSGNGWDYYCFACGASGTAPNMLVSLDLCKKEDEAITLLMKDFNLELPSQVTLEDFSSFKGLSLPFLKENGWENVKSGVLIPFFNENGDVVAKKIRTKYHGKDKYFYEMYENVPYGLQNLQNFDKNLPIYITEGETDCITMLQAGFQAIGVTSAHNFQPNFANYINDFNKIIVVKDNDTAGDALVASICKCIPSKTYILLLPNGIKDINNFHLFRCSSNIDTFKHKITELSVFPTTQDSFISACKENPELLKDKKAWTIIAKTIESPVDRDLFISKMASTKLLNKTAIKSMLDEAEIESKIRGKRLNREFFQDKNCYYKTTVVSGIVMEKQVSNFIIKPLYNKITEAGEIRVVTLINEFGESMTTEFTPEELSNCSDFITKVVSIGRNNFYGNNEDLTIIRDIIFKEATEKVESPLAIGHINSEHWVFEQCGIDKQGNPHKINEDKIITLDGRSYMPRSIASNDKENFDSYMPSFDLDIEPLNDEELRELLFAFMKNINSYNAWMGLGWCVANWYSDYVFNKYKLFPFLFIVGKRGSGKTTFASLLNRLFGYVHNSNGKSFDNSTPASMSRALNYSCSLPIWYDDYKDDGGGVGDKDTKTRMLLGAYNRQGGDRASKASTGLDTRSVRANLLISGEYSPTNSALKSRCVTVIINKHGRDNTLYNNVSKLFTRLTRNSFAWACKSQTNYEEYLDLMAKYINKLENSGLIERTAQNLAVVLAGFHIAFSHVLEDSELETFVNFAIENAKSSEKIIEESHHISQFFNDLASMLLSPSSEFNYGTHVVLYGGEIRLRKSDTYRLWQQFQPSRRLPVTVDTLRLDLENEPFYIPKTQRHRFDGAHSQCWTFDIVKMMENPLYKDFCELIKELAEKEEKF